MIKRMMCAFMIFFIIFLCGCGNADYVENQAYAVMLGIDLINDEIELTILYPKLAGGSGGAAGQESGSGYGTVSASGKYPQQAMDALRVNMPRELNLSALTMIVISKELADSDQLQSVFDILADNYRMYSSAFLALCDGKAKEFVSKQEPVIGSLLSEGLKALVDNAQQLGIIPASRLADVYYRANSVYSDPLVMSCRIDKDCLYEGSCALGRNSVVCDFDPEQTVLINLLTGDLRKFSYDKGNTAAYISVEQKPSIKIDTDEQTRINIKMELAAMMVSGDADIQQLGDMILKDISDLLNICKETGTEPFGFADKAAARFATLHSWKGYDWQKRFANCEISVDIKIHEIFSHN